MLCLGWSVAARADDAAVPKTHPDSSSWQDLFAHDLSNAIYPKGVWYFEDDVLTATEDQNIWTKEEYGNAIIDLEFKNVAGANSGVFVYGTDLKDWIPNSVEVQILDDSHPKWAEGSAHLALCRHFRPPGPDEERGQAGRRVEPHDRHLPGDRIFTSCSTAKWSRRWT